MNFQNFTDYGLDDVLIFMAVQWGVFMILAVYFELVLPIGPGVKKHPCFCFPKVSLTISLTFLYPYAEATAKV
jgi:hypothetical protein